MSKELKALERLKSSLKSYCYEFTSSMEDFERGLFEEDYEAVKLIETALKEYEGARNHIEALNKERIENSIKLKALEIIKDEFEIDFDDKKQKINIQSVEYPYPHIRFSLTREIKDKCKYDLLKEVLL